MSDCTGPSDKCFVKVYKCDSSNCESQCKRNNCVVINYSCNLVPEGCLHCVGDYSEWKLIHTITFDIDNFKHNIISEINNEKGKDQPNMAYLSGFYFGALSLLIDEYQKLLGVEIHEDYLKKEVV